VFALTSLTEGMPIAALEACAAGVPVLLSDRCHLPEVASEGAGRVEPLDADRLAAALSAMLGDEVARAEMGRRARALVERRFTLDRVVARLEWLYESVRAGSEREGARR
jgi:glycosyltransferase involved in cell wall biosynthesis